MNTPSEIIQIVFHAFAGAVRTVQMGFMVNEDLLNNPIVSGATGPVPAELGSGNVRSRTNYRVVCDQDAFLLFVPNGTSDIPADNMTWADSMHIPAKTPTIVNSGDNKHVVVQQVSVAGTLQLVPVK